MNIEVKNINNLDIAVVNSAAPLITDSASATDIIAAIAFDRHINRVVLNKEALDESFFDLSSGLAGEVLQKFTNYQVKLAIYGDFSVYGSKSLRDFIFESNKGQDIFFLDSAAAAEQKLATV